MAPILIVIAIFAVLGLVVLMVRLTAQGGGNKGLPYIG
jgi:hypothetical protein